MASINVSYLFILLFLLAFSANAQLSSRFYSKTCPKLESIVRAGMAKAVNQEKRMGASILRLFFHDCFVNGCDGSILLDDTPTMRGEKNALPNRNSVRGFEVIDDIKTQVEAACNGTVSCADILALAARDGVDLLGGPNWVVPLGRKDSRTASESEANNNLPAPSSNLSTLISTFAAQGFNAREMTALSGAHTIGMAQCRFFRSRIYNDTNINGAFAAQRQANCPINGGDNNLAPLDSTNSMFDNKYYVDLTNKRGLFHSDQELFNGGSQDGLVRIYSLSSLIFRLDFANAMIKMGNLSPASGTNQNISFSN
ncbi:peroxidase P7-like [Cucumis melo var. makuwa]|uniref:Peroxidase n=1 Tax=Cucumis melo var. makuwa TaxID=1194695 RepID=A0A5D3CI82_CUCMM|nr:peroxidase P7-like [Cucumis melo var. makuwa]